MCPVNGGKVSLLLTADKSSQSKQDLYIGIVPADQVPSPFCFSGLCNNERKSRGKTQEWRVTKSPVPSTVIASVPDSRIHCYFYQVCSISTKKHLPVRQSLLLYIYAQKSCGCPRMLLSWLCNTQSPCCYKRESFSSSQQTATLWAFKSRTDLSWVPLILFNVPFP